MGAGPGTARLVDVGVDSGTGVASDRKSQPHDSQNRPVRGAEHTGHGSPEPSPLPTEGAGAADDDVAAETEDATGGAPMRAPHSSQ